MVGPILYFRGLEGEHCLLSALVVLPELETPPTLRAANKTIRGESLHQRLGFIVWRYRFRLPCGSRHYSLAGTRYPVHLPVPGETLRIAFTACNGRESDQPGDDDPGRNANWRQLYQAHQQQPFQLLLQGGDQLYADGLWQAVPVLKRWRAVGCPPHIVPDEATREALRDYYFRLYYWLWGQRDLAPVLAQIPSLMMWDDHDIVDGWGSHIPALQYAPMFQAIGAAAREYFALFQQALAPHEYTADATAADGHFSQAHRLGDVALVIPDLRSQRTPEQVMGPAGWSWLTQQLDTLGGCQRLLLLSTVPLLNVDLSAIERLLVAIPGEQIYQDDLRDQWRSFAHREAWQRLSQRLLEVVAQGCGVSVISGEIHLGAWGSLTRGEHSFQQFTASGMVHPPPPTALARYLDWLGRHQRSPLAGTHLKMLKLPVYGRRYLCERNWLSLECATDGSLQATWRGENLPAEMTVSCPSA